MNKSLALAISLLLASHVASAQSLRPGSRAGLSATGNTPAVALPSQQVRADAAPLPADHIVALVNSEPITNNEVRARLARIESSANGQALPPRDELLRQIMERLIIEHTQTQAATEAGIKIDEAAINQTEESVAAQNGLSVDALRQRLKAMGVDLSQFRANLRNELLMQRIREREVASKVKVSESDIDGYLADHQSGKAAPTAINLAQILVEIPEGASAATVKKLSERAEALAKRARSGENFAVLARDNSDAGDRANGGVLGLRPTDRYPDLFVEATRTLKEGDIAGPLRSDAGFHIIKVLQKQGNGLPDASYTQTHARHILLRTSPQLSQDAAMARLKELRQRIVSGQAKFEDVARQVSQDGSAMSGGDLGWTTPGQFVPEFETPMNALALNQVSEPIASRFGVHLIQVLQRREVPTTTEQQREWVRNVLREQKADQAYEEWARDLRARAYVEYREPPQ